MQRNVSKYWPATNYDSPPIRPWPLMTRDETQTERNGDGRFIQLTGGSHMANWALQAHRIQSKACGINSNAAVGRCSLSKLVTYRSSSLFTQLIAKWMLPSKQKNWVPQKTVHFELKQLQNAMIVLLLLGCHFICVVWLAWEWLHYY